MDSDQPAPRPRSWAHREAQAYRRRRRAYVAATNAFVAWLQDRLEDVDEIEASVSGRPKDVRSVEHKLRARDRLSPGRDGGFADLPDLIGLRVVVRLESEIDGLYELFDLPTVLWIHSGVQNPESQCPVHRAGRQIGNTESLRDRTSHCALADTGWAVDRYDEPLSGHASLASPS